MAASQIPHRSISLPARLHPINPTSFEFELLKLKSCVSKQVPVISSDFIQSDLIRLAKLYNSVEQLVQSDQATQKSLILPESLLDGSMELIDSCNIIRELFQMIRENVQTLQSALRRKGQDSAVQSDITSYFSFRKKMNGCTSKSIRALKKLDTKITSGSNNANEHVVTKVLTEVREVSIAILKNVLLFLSRPMPRSWNFVSKMMITKAGKDQSFVSEVGSVDLALNNLRGKIKVQSATSFDGKMVQRGLQDLDSCFLGLEGGLENLFRQMIRSRVTFLNILNDH